MLFILKQSVLNGTVTMRTNLLGIEADSFNEAKDVVKNLEGHKKFKSIFENDSYISFSIEQNDSKFNVTAIMFNKELEIKRKNK